MSPQFLVETYLVIAAVLAAAKLSESQCSNSVSVLIGLTWPVYIYLWLQNFFQRRRERGL